MTIPKDLTRNDILEAVTALRDGRKTRWGASKKYVLVYEGECFAPKAVLGLAIALSDGVGEWDVGDFSGGKRTNDVLRGLGFKIVEKSEVSGD